MSALRILSAESPEALALEMGGKARNLRILARHGLPVPRWLCVSAAAFDEGITPIRPAIAEILRGCDPGVAEARARAAAAIRELFDRLTVPAAVERELRMAIATLGAEDALFAVRSSALGEDAAHASFAGLLDTFLCVAAADVPSRVLACWASAFGERVLSYLHARGGRAEAARVAVVVQRMVESVASGVLFVANPTGGRDEVVIVAGYGLGEGVVGGRVETDTFVIERESEFVRPTVVTKRRMVMPDGRGATTEREVPAAWRDRPVLQAEQLAELLALGERANNLYDRSQDIEWAIGPDGGCWITQCRPITTTGPGRTTVYDNSNIVEGYPGITLPLTFSLIDAGYETVFSRALLAFGVSRRGVRSRASALRSMVGHLEGRVYYNLSSWYRVFALLPLAQHFRPVWDEMMGVQAPSFPLRPRRRGDQLRRLPATLRLALHFFGNLLFLNRRMGRLRRRFRALYEEFWQRDLGMEDLHGLVERHEELSARVNAGWELTILNDLYAITFSALVRRQLQRYGVDDSRRLFNDLLCGEEVESAEPVYSAVALGQMVRERPELRSRLERALADPAPLSLRDAAGAVCPAFVEAFERHLHLYGDRAFEELKLETRVYRQDPKALLRAVLGYAESGLTVAGLRQRESAIRWRAEGQIAGRLRHRPVRYALLRACLVLARRSVRYRESARLDRARGFGMVRTIFLELGERLAAQGLLGSPEDVFCLTIGEVASFIRGTSPNARLDTVVAIRKDQYVEYRRRRPPDRLEVSGIPYARPLPQRADRSGGGDGRRLTGVGCGPGIAEGEAVIVRQPHDTLRPDGKVLVTEMTDPGWVFLMVSAAALVAERGSILSHTAIIGRELGIPTVVGVANATRLIADGARLRVDGGTGEVVLLD